MEAKIYMKYSISSFNGGSNYEENYLDKKTPLLFYVAPQFILTPQKILAYTGNLA